MKNTNSLSLKPMPAEKGPLSKNTKFAPGEKKAIAIVLTGNFLEYFDLMLFSRVSSPHY